MIPQMLPQDKRRKDFLLSRVQKIQKESMLLFRVLLTQLHIYPNRKNRINSKTKSLSNLSIMKEILNQNINQGHLRLAMILLIPCIPKILILFQVSKVGAQLTEVVFKMDREQ
jgi:hypothetical protein